MNALFTKASKQIDLSEDLYSTKQIYLTGWDFGCFESHNEKIRSLAAESSLTSYGNVILYVRPTHQDSAENNKLIISTGKNGNEWSSFAVLGVKKEMFLHFSEDLMYLGSKYLSLSLETTVLGEWLETTDPLKLRQEHTIVRFELHTYK